MTSSKNEKFTNEDMDTIDIIYIAFLTSMNNIKKITSFSLVAGMFLIAALATTTASRTAFAQNMSNQTVANQTSSAMNQTSSAMNQTSTTRPQQNRNLQHQMFRILERLWKK